MNNPSAVTNHQDTDIPSGNGTAAPVPPSTLARVLESTHPTSRVGCAFHIMAHGKLARRGIVLNDTPNSFIVQFVDVWGLPDEIKKVSKERATTWKWFINVQHSNHTYDKLFAVN
jgi:hypothetical protein